jgi:hypothetical protein
MVRRLKTSIMRKLRIVNAKIIITENYSKPPIPK